MLLICLFCYFLQFGKGCLSARMSIISSDLWLTTEEHLVGEPAVLPQPLLQHHLKSLYSVFLSLTSNSQFHSYYTYLRLTSLYLVCTSWVPISEGWVLFHKLQSIGDAKCSSDVWCGLCRHLLKQFHYHTKSACVGQMQAAHLILAGVQPMKVLIKPQGCYLWKGSGQGTPNLPVPLHTLRYHILHPV